MVFINEKKYVYFILITLMLLSINFNLLLVNDEEGWFFIGVIWLDGIECSVAILCGIICYILRYKGI